MGARITDGRRLWLLMLLVVLAAWFASTPLLAATAEPAQMDWLLIGMNLFGALPSAARGRACVGQAGP